MSLMNLFSATRASYSLSPGIPNSVTSISFSFDGLAHAKCFRARSIQDAAVGLVLLFGWINPSEEKGRATTKFAAKAVCPKLPWLQGFEAHLSGCFVAGKPPFR